MFINESEMRLYNAVMPATIGPRTSSKLPLIFAAQKLAQVHHHHLSVVLFFEPPPPYFSGGVAHMHVESSGDRQCSIYEPQTVYPVPIALVPLNRL